METYFQYGDLSFVRTDDGVWISKNWAINGPTGCAFDRVMEGEWAEKLEKAFQADLVKRGVTFQPDPLAKTKDKKQANQEKPKGNLSKESAKEDKKVKRPSSMVGSFNPFQSPS